MCNTPGLRRICRECYTQPEQVYRRLKRSGMNIVTLTDHDAIDGAEGLRKYEDFFLSEEVTVQMPSDTEMHLGVYGINDRDHDEIQRRRNDFVGLVMYLSERKRFFSVNHVFSGLTGRRESEDFAWISSHVPALETRNGQMWSQANEDAARLAVRLGKIAVAGSDSHTLRGLGLTYTEVPGTHTVEDFLDGLRAGWGRVHGQSGSYSGLTIDVFCIVKELVLEKPWTLVLLPFSLLIPAFVMGHWMNEVRFCQKWAEAMERGEERVAGAVGKRLEATVAG